MRPVPPTRLRRPLAAALLIVLAAPLAGQQLKGYEVADAGLFLAQDPVWIGGAVQAGWRPGGGTRLSLGLGLGRVDGRTSGRGELLAHFILSPTRRSGVSPYAFGGAAGVVGPREAAYLVLGLGLERGPGGASGWFLEGGVGGGARIAAGWRWRVLK